MFNICRSITVNYMRNLTAIDHIRKEVTFLKLDSNNGETEKCEVGSTMNVPNQQKQFFLMPNHMSRNVKDHYKNRPIKIYRKFHLQELKISR